MYIFIIQTFSSSLLHVGNRLIKLSFVADIYRTGPFHLAMYQTHKHKLIA